MAEPFKIAVAGLGTVGAGTLRLFESQRELLEARCQRPLVVSAVAARDRGIDRGINLDGYAWFDDAVTLAAEGRCGRRCRADRWQRRYRTPSLRGGD